MRLPRHSTVAAYMALFVALGGTSYAAVKLPRNSVGASQIKTGGVGSSEVKNGALRMGWQSPRPLVAFSLPRA